MKAPRLTQAERTRIKKLLKRPGMKQARVARMVGRSAQTVNKIALNMNELNERHAKGGEAAASERRRIEDADRAMARALLSNTRDKERSGKPRPGRWTWKRKDLERVARERWSLSEGRLRRILDAATELQREKREAERHVPVEEWRDGR